MWTTMISVIFVFLSHSKQHVNLSIYLKKNEKIEHEKVCTGRIFWNWLFTKLFFCGRHEG